MPRPGGPKGGSYRPLNESWVRLASRARTPISACISGNSFRGPVAPPGERQDRLGGQAIGLAHLDQDVLANTAAGRTEAHLREEQLASAAGLASQLEGPGLGRPDQCVLDAAHREGKFLDVLQLHAVEHTDMRRLCAYIGSICAGSASLFLQITNMAATITTTTEETRIRMPAFCWLSSAPRWPHGSGRER